MDKFDEKAHDMCETLKIRHTGNRAVIASALREAAAEAFTEAADNLTERGLYEEDNVQVRRLRDKAAALSRLTAPEGKPCIHGGVDLCWDVKCDGFHRPTAPGKGE